MPRLSLKCLATGALLKIRENELLFGEGEKFREEAGVGPLPPNLGEFIDLHSCIHV